MDGGDGGNLSGGLVAVRDSVFVAVAALHGDCLVVPGGLCTGGFQDAPNRRSGWAEDGGAGGVPRLRIDPGELVSIAAGSDRRGLFRRGAGAGRCVFVFCDSVFAAPHGRAGATSFYRVDCLFAGAAGDFGLGQSEIDLILDTPRGETFTSGSLIPVGNPDRDE